MGEERKNIDIPVHDQTPRNSAVFGDEGVKSHIMQIDNIDGHPVDVQWPLDPIKEKKLMRKVDWILVPWLFVLFLLAFLDRVNIGNARIQGLEADLGMYGDQYNIALFIFFVPYILLEIPSNIFIKKLKPSNWISAIMFVWGIATICQGLTHNFGGLLACRIIIGAAEAGFFPGCIYLLSMYYKRWELQQRIVWFFSASILAGSFGGLLAFAIAKMNGLGGKSGWAWIFILEGALTCVAAIASKWIVCDFPEDCRFLTEEERAMLLARIKVDTADTHVDRLTWKTFLWIMKDWKIYCSGFMYLCCVTTSYSIALFLPTILKSMGYTSVQAQLLSIGPYASAFTFTMIVAYLADHYHHRFGWCILGTVVSMIGYIIIMSVPARLPGVLYFATFLMITGAYITQPLILTWSQNNQGGHYKRAISSAWTVSFGNISGIIASTIYNQPPFTRPYGAGLALMFCCFLFSCVYYFGLKRENVKTEHGERDYRLQYPQEKLNNMGDDHPGFRFAL